MGDFIPDKPGTASGFVPDVVESATGFIPDTESVLGSGISKAKLAYQEVAQMFEKQQQAAGMPFAPTAFSDPKMRALAEKAPDIAERLAKRAAEIEETKAKIAATEPQYDPENPVVSTAKRAASTAVGLVGELPLFAIGGGAAGTAAKAALSGAAKAAPGAAKVAQAALTQAGAFAGESALRGQTPEEVAIQGATGAAFGTAGQVAPYGLKTAAEGLVFIGAEKLKGHDLEAKDYGEILGTLVGMKAAGKAYTKATDITVDIKKAAAISRARTGMDKAKSSAAAEVMTTPEGKALVEEVLREPGISKAAKDLLPDIERAMESRRELKDITPGTTKRVIEPSDIAQQPLFQGPTVAERLASASRANIESRTLKNKAKIRAIRDEHKAAMDAAVREVPLTPEEISYKSDYSLKPSLREEALVRLQEIFPGTTPMERLSLLRERQKQVSIGTVVEPFPKGKTFEELSAERAAKGPDPLSQTREEYAAQIREGRPNFVMPPSDLYRSTVSGMLEANSKLTKRSITPAKQPIPGAVSPDGFVPGKPAPGSAVNVVGFASERAARAITPEVQRTIVEETVQAWEPISPKWTADPTAETGRPTHYYGIERGDFSTRKAEVVPVVTESNVPMYNARTANGRDLGTYPTPREAMQAVETSIATPTELPMGTVPPGQRGVIDPDLLLPRPVRRGVERVSKDVKAVLDTLKVLKEARQDRKAFEAEYDDLAKFNKFISLTHGLLQIRDLNKNLPWLTGYVDTIKTQHQIKSMRLEVANDHLKSWQSLGKDMGDRLTSSMIEETIGKREFTPEQLAKYKLSAEALLLRQKIKSDFAQFLQDAEHLLKQRAAGKLEGPALDAELKGITDDFTAMREKPYFPLARWGREVVTAKRGDRVLHIENFESGVTSEPQIVLAKARIAKKFANDNSVLVTRSTIPDSVMGFQGMPPRMVERMATEMLNDPTLTPKQSAEIRETLQALMYKLSPEASFRKHLLSRKGTPGYSMDGMRAYASYMLHGANHLGRIQFGDALTEYLNQGHIAAKRLQDRGMDNHDYVKLVNWMEDHRAYAMNPKNEWAQLRSAAFMWYLGFMPKAAFVNLTQTGLVTLPYLGARYGDVAATGQILRAMKDIPQITLRGKKILTLDERRLFEELTPILDESFAAALGATADGNMLARVLPQTSVGRGVANVSSKASYLFQIAEGYNRRVAALATYRLAVEKGKSYEQAKAEAQAAVEGTQFEYASWNRPVFMRGKASVLTVFMQYMQNMLYFLGRDPGAKRALVMLTAAAGVQGLPFMEDMLDILDKLLSTKNVKFDSRKEMREAALELSLNPDLIMHGAGRYGFGIPEVDLSGSMSMGRPIRATEALLKGKDFAHQFSDTAQSVGGAVFSVPIEMWKFAGDDKPNWKQSAERIMPSIGRSIAQAYRYASKEVAEVRGGKDVPMPGGKELLQGNITEVPLKTTGDIAATATGFQLRDIAAERERVYAIKDTQLYYQERHKNLIEHYAYALNSKQPEAIKDAGLAIAQFNRDVPYKSFAINIGQLQASIKQRGLRNALEEVGLVGQKQGAEVAIEYAPSYR